MVLPPVLSVSIQATPSAMRARLRAKKVSKKSCLHPLQLLSQFQRHYRLITTPTVALQKLNNDFVSPLNGFSSRSRLRKCRTSKRTPVRWLTNPIAPPPMFIPIEFPARPRIWGGRSRVLDRRVHPAEPADKIRPQRLSCNAERHRDHDRPAQGHRAAVDDEPAYVVRLEKAGAYTKSDSKPITPGPTTRPSPRK